MPTNEIINDQQLRAALNGLTPEHQRQLGAQFVNSVSHLSTDSIIHQGLQVLNNPNHTPAEIAMSYKSVKALAIEKYTSCGRDADWAAQAEHFVASALAACLLPEEQLNQQDNLAWRAAMQSRMAKNCEMIMTDRGEIDNEANQQYRIASDFLAKID